MTITKRRFYPREVFLVRAGTRVTIRPVERADAHELLEFFMRIPKDDSFYLNESVIPEVIVDWVHHIHFDEAFRVVAGVDHRIVADGTLYRHRGGGPRHIGEIRVVVDPSYRNEGIGSLIIRELIDAAYDDGFERVIFQLVGGKQDNGINLAERLGFTRAETRPDFVKDLDGNPQDVVVMELPLDMWPVLRQSQKKAP